MRDPSKNVAASEDFFMLVLESHVLVPYMTVFKMASVEDNRVLCSQHLKVPDLIAL